MACTRTVSPQTHDQRALACARIGLRIRELVDVQQVRDQQREAESRRERREREALPLHEVRADHDHEPATGHGNFAESAVHQMQRRCGVRPACEQAAQTDQQQAGHATGREPQSGRNDREQQRVAEPSHRLLRQHAVLDHAAATREGRDALVVPGIGAVAGVETVVQHVHAGMRDEREQQCDTR